MTREEIIETMKMLNILKKSALKSGKDTAILNVNIDSFNFVLDKTINALKQEAESDGDGNVAKKMVHEILKVRRLYSRNLKEEIKKEADEWSDEEC